MFENMMQRREARARSPEFQEAMEKEKTEFKEVLDGFKHYAYESIFSVFKNTLLYQGRLIRSVFDRDYHFVKDYIPDYFKLTFGGNLKKNLKDVNPERDFEKHEKDQEKIAQIEEEILETITNMNGLRNPNDIARAEERVRQLERQKEEVDIDQSINLIVSQLEHLELPRDQAEYNEKAERLHELEKLKKFPNKTFLGEIKRMFSGPENHENSTVYNVFATTAKLAHLTGKASKIGFRKLFAV